MFQVVMRTDVDDLLTVSPNSTSKESTLTSPISHELIRDKTLNMNDDDCCNDLLSEKSVSICSSKRVSLKRDNDFNHTEGGEHMKKDESSATLWMDDNEIDNSALNVINDNENFENNDNDISIISKDSMSAVYNFGCDSSVCKNNINDTDNNESITSNDHLSNNISYHLEEFFNTEENESIVSEELINKSFTNNPNSPSSRRNSIISLHSQTNGYAIKEPKNALDTRSTCSRRSSRCSLSLSIHSMPCYDSHDYEERLVTPTSATIYNNYSDNLLFFFPSPPNSPNSPTFISDVVSEVDFDPCPYSSQAHPQNDKPVINEKEDTECLNYGIHHHHRNSYIPLNEPSFHQPSPTLASPTINSTANHLYHSFSPDLISPSPIVQSLSADNLGINSCDYSCTFNHISSTPNIHTPTPHQHRDT